MRPVEAGPAPQPAMPISFSSSCYGQPAFELAYAHSSEQVEIAADTDIDAIEAIAIKNSRSIEVIQESCHPAIQGHLAQAIAGEDVQSTQRLVRQGKDIILPAPHTVYIQTAPRSESEVQARCVHGAV